MNHVKQILIVPSGTITAEEKKSAQDAGYVVIVTDEPEKVKLVTPSASLDGIDLLNAFTIAFSEGIGMSDAKDKFFKEMVRQIRSKK